MFGGVLAAAVTVGPLLWLLTKAVLWLLNRHAVKVVRAYRGCAVPACGGVARCEGAAFADVGTARSVSQLAGARGDAPASACAYCCD